MSRIERLQVTNQERWGLLVKTWATANNYLDGIDPVIPEDEKFRVHAERIGDYTISNCA